MCCLSLELWLFFHFYFHLCVCAWVQQIQIYWIESVFICWCIFFRWNGGSVSIKWYQKIVTVWKWPEQNGAKTIYLPNKQLFPRHFLIENRINFSFVNSPLLLRIVNLWEISFIHLLIVQIGSTLCNFIAEVFECASHIVRSHFTS